MTSPLEQIEEDRVDIDAILRSASERPPPPPTPDVVSTGRSPLHGLLETDAARAARLRRRSLVLAGGVVLAGATGAFVANHTLGATAAPHAPSDARSKRAAAPAPSTSSAPGVEAVPGSASALVAPQAVVEAIPNTAAHVALPTDERDGGRIRPTSRNRRNEEHPFDEAAVDGVGPNAPESPDRAEVLAALARVHDAVAACSARPGSALLRVTFASTGRVTTALSLGDFAHTPEGSCMARAVRAAAVPPFRKRTITVDYPFELR